MCKFVCVGPCLAQMCDTFAKSGGACDRAICNFGLGLSKKRPKVRYIRQICITIVRFLLLRSVAPSCGPHGLGHPGDRSISDFWGSDLRRMRYIRQIYGRMEQYLWKFVSQMCDTFAKSGGRVRPSDLQFWALIGPKCNTFAKIALQLLLRSVKCVLVVKNKGVM